MVLPVRSMGFEFSPVVVLFALGSMKKMLLLGIQCTKSCPVAGFFVFGMVDIGGQEGGQIDTKGMTRIVGQLFVDLYMEILLKYRFFLLIGIYIILQFYDRSELATIVFLVALLDLSNTMSKSKD